jgi:uncharacterized membrane protein YccC
MRDKGDRQHIHISGAGRQEGGGAGIRRRARGHNVVDQQNALAEHRRSAAAAHAEGIRDIMLARILGKANLRPRSLRPLKGRDASGDA